MISTERAQNVSENYFLYHFKVLDNTFSLTPYLLKSLFAKQIRNGIHLHRVCSSDKMTPIYFLRLSKVWSMLHHGSVGQVQSKEYYYMFTYTLCIFLLLFIIKFVFFSFSFFFLIKSQISATEYTFFFIRKIFYKKMSLKTPKTLRKW